MNRKVLLEMTQPIINELFKTMKKKHLTIEETARRIGVKRRAIERWHKGEHYPKSLSRVMILANAVEALKHDRRVLSRLTWGESKEIKNADLIKEYRRVFKKQGVEAENKT